MSLIFCKRWGSGFVWFIMFLICSSGFFVNNSVIKKTDCRFALLWYQRNLVHCKSYS